MRGAIVSAIALWAVLAALWAMSGSIRPTYAGKDVSAVTDSESVLREGTVEAQGSGLR